MKNTSIIFTLVFVLSVAGVVSAARMPLIAGDSEGSLPTHVSVQSLPSAPHHVSHSFSHALAQAIGASHAAVQMPSVTVLTPNGGEVFNAGGELTVTWNATAYTSDAPVHIALEIPDADGMDNSLIIPWTATANDGSETFTLPTTTPSGQYGILVQIQTPPGSATPSMLSDRSDALFTIHNLQNACLINSFTAQTMSVHLGSSAYLHWTTSGCAHVFLGASPTLATGTYNTGALFAETTYRLYASAAELPAGCTSFVGYSPTTGTLCAINATVVPLTIGVRA